MSDSIFSDSKTITVIKCNYRGEEVWRYQGQLIDKGLHYIRLEAYFDHPNIAFHGMELCKGDRFLETYYNDRWYNIYKVHDRLDDHFKGWYCNIGHPALFEGEVISYRDLALDLLVFPDGRQIVLDEDEFKNLPLSKQERLNARAALRKLQEAFSRKSLKI